MLRFLCLLLATNLADDARIPFGSSKLELEVAGKTLDVYTFKSEGFHDGPMTIVFHGLARNAQDYRDAARLIGMQTGALIVAPEFDLVRFPPRDYTRGGVRRDDGTSYTSRGCPQERIGRQGLAVTPLLHPVS